MSSTRSHSRFLWLTRFAERLRTLRGWRRHLTAFAYGALCAFAFSPADAIPALWVSFPALIFLLQGTPNWRRAFFVGWSFAFGFFTVDLYWTAASMFVDIKHFWWAVPLAIFGLPSVCAIYYGIAAALARLYGLRTLSGVIVFGLLWFLADYARGNLFTGFPWNIEGYIWSDFLPVLQITSVIGIYGLTLLTILTASIPAVLAEQTARKAEKLIVAGFFITFAAIAIWGSMRMLSAPYTVVDDVYLRLVQPDTRQRSKWQPSTKDHNFNDLLSISTMPSKKPLTAIIWPETAATYFLTQDLKHRRAVAGVAPPNGTVITGVLRSETDALGTQQFFNSLIVISAGAEVIGTYDKAHLVPFGEYMPYRDILSIPSIAGLGLDFSSGDGAHNLRIPGLPPFSPFICYEAIFPGTIADRNDPPQFLLNVTNDGWYGNTAGPYQHFAIARVRAVEEGVPLVRAANTGISGIIDPYGRITARLGLGEHGFLDSELPQALPKPPPFTRWGEIPVWLMFAGLAIAALLSRCLVKKAQK